MKKFLVLFVAAISIFAACNKEIIPEPQSTASTEFMLFASTPDTKTAVNDAMSDVEWVANDAINVFHAISGTTDYLNDNSFVVSDLSAGSFNGNLSSPLNETNSYDWYAFYPYQSNKISPEVGEKGYVTVGSTYSAAQTQDGCGNMKHLAGKNIPLFGVAESVAADETPSIVMNQAVSVIDVKVTNSTEESIAISSVEFTASEDIVGTYFIGITKSQPEFKVSGTQYVSNVAKLTVSGNNSIAPGEIGEFYIAIKPFKAESDDVLKVSVNGFEKEIPHTNDVEFKSGKIKTINFNYNPSTSSVTGNYKYTFAESVISASGDYTLGDLIWNVSNDGGYYGYDATKGQQIGSGNKPAKSLILSTNKYGDSVDNIIVETSGASSVDASLAISVNGTAYNCDGATSVKISAANTAYMFAPVGESQKGTIVISWDNSSQKAIYIKSIEINKKIENVPVTGISLKSTATITVGGTETLIPTITPSDATNKAVTWSSDNTSVATVNENGVVTGVSAGSAVITVTTVDGKKTAFCTVTVSASTGWTRCTSVDALLAGGTFIMGYEATAKSGIIVPLRTAEAEATTTANGYFRSGTTLGASNGNTIDMSNLPQSTTEYELTIEASTNTEGAICLKMSTGNYLGASKNGSSKNTGRLYEEAGSAETDIVLTYDSNTQSFSLSSPLEGSYKYLKYNTSSPRFAYYDSAGNKIVFYKK